MEHCRLSGRTGYRTNLVAQMVHCMRLGRERASISTAVENRVARLSNKMLTVFFQCLDEYPNNCSTNA